MSESPTLLIWSLLAGIVLGALFFGGLWWTTKKILSSTQPALWLLASLLARTTLTLAGFYLVAQGVWQRLLICLLGFLLARMIVIRLTRRDSPRFAGRAS